MRTTWWRLGLGLCSLGLLIACGDDGAAGGSGGSGGGGGGGSGGSGGSGGATGGGGGIQPPAPACSPGQGSSATVAAPELIAELGDRWHESWLASPVVADLDGDGTLEIIAARHGLVLGWHLDGTIVFSEQVDGRCWASPVVADLRPDLPGLEIAQASSDKIYAWRADGTPLPGFPYTFRGELRSLAAGDIDGDGLLELVSVTTQNLQANGQRDIVIAVNPDGSTVAGFPPNTSGASGCDDACYVYNGYDQNVAIGDVNGDGKADIFATQDNAYNSLHEGDGRAFDCAPAFKNKTKFMGVRGLHDLAEAQQGWAPNEATALQAHHTNTAPAIVDLDGDGSGELVYLASVQNAAQDQREQGVALWAMRHDGTRPPGWETPLHVSGYLSGLWDYGDNIVAITNQVTVADIDPAKPGPEFIFAGFDGKIHAVDAAQNLLFSVTYTTDPEVGTGGVLVADLNQDGVPELVFTTYSTKTGVSALFILDAGGNLRHELPLPARGAMPVPTIADADGDGTLDIVVSLKDGGDGKPQVQVYRVPGSADNCLLWPTGRGNLLRNGNVVLAP
ncbi:MAG: VCBS repeat-containing protein [Polyangiaceae bacterium]|nr:VCBS repeat-containing protein [Polyangiaceae bacterium]